MEVVLTSQIFCNDLQDFPHFENSLSGLWSSKLSPLGTIAGKTIEKEFGQHQTEEPRT